MIVAKSILKAIEKGKPAHIRQDRPIWPVSRFYV